jgi:hypothetical protein
MPGGAPGTSLRGSKLQVTRDGFRCHSPSRDAAWSPDAKGMMAAGRESTISEASASRQYADICRHAPQVPSGPKADMNSGGTVASFGVVSPNHSGLLSRFSKRLAPAERG